MSEKQSFHIADHFAGKHHAVFIVPESHTDDFLHPNETGYVIIDGSINLKLFK